MGAIILFVYMHVQVTPRKPLAHSRPSEIQTTIIEIMDKPHHSD